MDIKQDTDPSNLLELIKLEPGIDPDQTKQNEHCSRKLETFKNEYGDVFESQTFEQFGYVDKVKEEIKCEMPEIEERSDELPTKIDHDSYSENVQSFPFKQELENTKDVKIIDTSGIKQEVCEYIKPKTESELLTSHCDLPTLKIENIDCPDYYDLEYPCSSKSLKNTSKVILKNKKRIYPCPICQKNFPASKSRSTHIDGHFKKRYVVCQFCGKILKKLEIFQHFFIHVVKNGTKNHIDNKSLKYNLYTNEQKSIDYFDKKSFDTCSKKLNEKFNFQSHVIIHSSENKLFKCDVCTKGFNDKFVFQRHLNIHSGKRPFNCDICFKKFTQKYHLQQHLLIHSGKKPFKCDICFKEFINKYALQKHYLLIHNGKKPFKCDICSKEFTQKSTLLNHLILHSGSKPFKCNICSKGFNDKSSLHSHLMIHSGDKPFKCEICSKEFTKKSHLQQHLVIHNDKKQFKCDICFKEFIGKSHLGRHSSIHSYKNAFKCDVCSKGFNDKSTFRRHLIIHSDDKPFKCDVCSKEFNYKSHLRRHLIIHNGDSF
ncbi:unnamed protein product [Psylliodes chrysocephalus]|uniref:C2H2-type domain-containing protein n=1 Tax=Psylliodes chrysocephalus TaxID=3402493 RepID=A0A9P0CZ78_9CUCU|nr:unnamed protein product [Psylliodes chrysocephala]